MTLMNQSILLATLLLLSGGFSGDVHAGQKYAFLVGVGGYDEKQLKKLPYAKADIIEFRDLLLESGFPKDNVVMLVDDLAALPTGGLVGRYLPEHKKIRNELSILLPALEPDDELVIGLAGHGIQFKGDDNPYFCPLDADLTDKSTLISLNWLYDQLTYDSDKRTGCPARAKLLIVDACRKDPESSIRRNSAGPELASVTRPQLTEPPAGVVALFSCAEGQAAMEHAPLKHGVFFYHVLEGLKGAADGDEDTNVTLDEVIAYTKARTTRYVRKELRAIQSPRQKGYFDGTWVLRTIDRPKELTNSIGMKLKLIPAGSFMMGSNQCSREHRNEHAEMMKFEPEMIDTVLKKEGPRHHVRITRPFYFGAYEVTRGEFARFVRDQGYVTEPERDGAGAEGWELSDSARDPKFSWRNPGFRQTDDHPVVNITVKDALAFCKWLTAKEQVEFRLPTEAEWEYACRAATKTDFFCGDAPEGLYRFANIADTSRKKHTKQFAWSRPIQTSDNHAFTSPVGSFKSNQFGLYDMHGNVEEYCTDRRFNYGEKSIADPRVDEAIQSVCTGRRGGSWNSVAFNSRSSARGMSLPSDWRSYSIGFRIVREAR